jgi:hypothetical protein
MLDNGHRLILFAGFALVVLHGSSYAFRWQDDQRNAQEIRKEMSDDLTNLSSKWVYVDDGEIDNIGDKVRQLPDSDKAYLGKRKVSWDDIKSSGCFVWIRDQQVLEGIPVDKLDVPHDYSFDLRTAVLVTKDGAPVIIHIDLSKSVVTGHNHATRWDDSEVDITFTSENARVRFEHDVDSLAKICTP